jgi:hypothetical protein
VGVIGGGEGDGPVGAADPGDDRGQGVGELGTDDEEPFGVGLGRGDGQQRDELAGGGQAVLDQAVVRQLGEFLDADAGVAQDLDDGPGPERVVFLAGQVPPLPAGGLLGPGPGGRVG